MTRSQREVIEIICRFGEPLTRAAYIGVIWNDEPPADWDAEEEADLPRFLQGAPDDQTFDCARALAGEYDRLDEGDARKWLDFDGVPAALVRDRRGYERGFIWVASLEGDGRWREWNSSELMYKAQILSEAVFREIILTPTRTALSRRCSTSGHDPHRHHPGGLPRHQGHAARGLERLSARTQQPWALSPHAR
jgi:hypothetical protein